MTRVTKGAETVIFVDSFHRVHKLYIEHSTMI
jgi:hypothetical protein